MESFSFLFQRKSFLGESSIAGGRGALPYEYASCQRDQGCTQQDFSVGYGGFPFPSMSVGDDAHGVPLNQLPFSEETDMESFSFLFQRKSFWGESLREGLFSKSPSLIKPYSIIPNNPAYTAALRPERRRLRHRARCCGRGRRTCNRRGYLLSVCR